MNRFRHRPVGLLLAALSWVLAAACGSQVVPDTPATAEARRARVEGAVLPVFVIAGEPVRAPTLAQRMEELGVPGVSVAVLHDGVVEWARGYGVAEAGTDRRVTPETLFQAASISKPVAALAALTLVEEGRIELDGDVNRRLRSWKVPDGPHTRNRPVTLRGLLTHTAGLTVWGFPGYGPDDEVPGTVGVLDGEGNTDPIRVFQEPGESWRYSGGGYTVVQQLLEDVTGMPFPDLMRVRVLDPLGMTRSTYRQPLPEDRWQQAATGHRGDGTPVEGRWHIYPEMAAAGLWTTPSDLARYAMAVQKAFAGEPGAIVSSSTAAAMLARHENDWGLGPAIQGDGTRFGHGGSNEGYRAQFTSFIREGEGAFVMTNSDTGGRLAAELILTLADAYGWPGISPEEKVVVDVEPAVLEGLAGSYEVPDLGPGILIAVEGRGLRATGERLGTVVLLPTSDTTFFDREDGQTVVFHPGAEGVEIVFGGSVRGRRVGPGQLP